MGANDDIDDIRDPFKQLLSAVFRSEENTYARVEKYLNRGGDVNNRLSSNNNTLLITAAYIWNDDPQLIDLLLNAGANPNAQNMLGSTVLFNLIHNKNPTNNRLKRLLQEDNLDLSLRVAHKTVLEKASEKGDKERIALLEAYAASHPSSLQETKEKGAGGAPKILSEKEHLLQLFKESMPSMVNLGKTKAKTALDKAKDKLALEETLAAKFATFFAQGHTLSSDECFTTAVEAIKAHSLPILKVLVEKGNCDPMYTKKNDLIIETAIVVGDAAIFEYLLPKIDIAEIEKQQRNFLFRAVLFFADQDVRIYDRMHIIETLLEKGLDQKAIAQYINPESPSYKATIETIYNEYIRNATEWRKAGTKK